MKLNRSHLLYVALAALSLFAGALWAFGAVDPTPGLLLAGAAGAVDWEVLNKSLDRIEDRLVAVDELADRVMKLEQKPGALERAPAAPKFGEHYGQTLLRKSEDMLTHYGSGAQDQVKLGEFLRGVAGMKSTPAVAKALSVGTDSAGGYAVPRATFGQIMAALVPNSALLQAGVGVEPVGDAKQLTTAVVNAIPTAAWRLENGAVAESDPTFRSVVSTPKSLSFRFKVSRELLQDAPNMERALELVVAQALAKELDRAGLRGSGTNPEPLGILGTLGVYLQSSGANGASGPGWDTVLSVFDDILVTNAPEPKAAIMAPRSWVRLMGQVDSNGQPKQMPKALERMRFLSTSQVPINLTVGTSTDCSELYVGDFSAMSLMVRETASFQVLNELYAEAGQIGFVGHLRADVSLWYPSAFAVVTGLR